LLLSALCAFATDETGQPAPRFRAKTTAGDQFNNASVKGKVVLFEFWTTWCKYCEAEASMVDDVAKEFADKGLIVLAVDVLEPDQKVKKYLVEHPRSVPIVLTKDTNLAAMYNAQSYPIYVVIDRDGNIARLPISLTTGTLLSRLSIQIGDLLTRSMQKLRPLW
jgi:thiol-disulfide isomerase/thioredoxin